MCVPRGLTRGATWHGRVGDENFLIYSGRVGIESSEIFGGPGGLDRKEKDTVFGRAGGRGWGQIYTGSAGSRNCSGANEGPWKI